MPYVDRYPQADAHGVAIKRFKVRKLTSGQIKTFLDDGFDVVEGEVIAHTQLAQAIACLKKRVKDPTDPAGRRKVAAFVLVDGTFSGSHPLADGVTFPRYADDPKKYDAIMDLFGIEKAETAEKAKADAAPLIDAAVRDAAAKKAVVDDAVKKATKEITK